MSLEIAIFSGKQRSLSSIFQAAPMSITYAKNASTTESKILLRCSVFVEKNAEKFLVRGFK